MIRRIAVTAAAALLGCLVTAAPALAVDDQGKTSSFGHHLRYRTTTWTGAGTAMSVMAPRAWPLVLTPAGEARFNDPARPRLLTMGYRGEGPLRPQLRSKVAALQGTPGLRVLRSRGRGRGDSAFGELSYRWTPRGGTTRWVHYRYVGNDAYAVAGPLVDRNGLEAVLDTASSTGDCN